VLIPSGRSYSETRRMMRWFRRIDDRLLFGAPTTRSLSIDW